MQELEKILEEVDVKIAGSMGKRREGLWEAEEIIRKHIKNEEDILKFYYCESEDDYYIGKRVQNMYYAKYEPGGFTWFMSRYLPWGTDGYPSEPKEIPFTEWMEGFIRKHMNDSKCGNCSRRKWYQIGYKDRKNDGWIPVEDHLPNHLLDCEVTLRNGSRSIARYVESDGCWMDHNDFFSNVIAWKEPSEPYRPERSE